MKLAQIIPFQAVTLPDPPADEASKKIGENKTEVTPVVAAHSPSSAQNDATKDPSKNLAQDLEKEVAQNASEKIDEAQAGVIRFAEFLKEKKHKLLEEKSKERRKKALALYKQLQENAPPDLMRGRFINIKHSGNAH